MGRPAIIKCGANKPVTVGNYQLKLSDVNNCFLDTTITLGNISGPDLSVKNMQPAKCSYNPMGRLNLL
jgi:hypothetical protein